MPDLLPPPLLSFPEAEDAGAAGIITDAGTSSLMFLVTSIPFPSTAYSPPSSPPSPPQGLKTAGGEGTLTKGQARGSNDALSSPLPTPRALSLMLFLSCSFSHALSLMLFLSYSFSHTPPPSPALLPSSPFQGLKMAGAAGTITKGAGSSLKLARQSSVHFVRRALQRAGEWQAGQEREDSMAGAAGTITKGAGSSLKLARQSAVHFVKPLLLAPLKPHNPPALQGFKMAGAAGTITKGAGSSLKLARQSAVHFVRRALQRADQWHSGTLLPHLQRVHPDLQPSPSLLAEPSPLPWTPGPGGVGTPGLGGVGRSSGVVTTPGGTASAPAAAAAGAGGLDGSGAGLSGAGAPAPGLLSLFNRQRLALFPPSPPRPPIPLSFAPTATTTAAAAAAAAAGADDTAMGGESPALEIAGLSPLRGAGGGEEGGAGGAGGGVREAEADSLVASMLIAGSPCDSSKE
ncbi:unnamed protein product, partial [Closterium sp. NIES-54]